MKSAPHIRAVAPPGAPPPLSPYSHAIAADGILYVSGLVSLDEQGRTAGKDVVEQTRNVLRQLQVILASESADLSAVVHNAIFLKDLADYKAMNTVYAEFFPDRPPARYCIQAHLVRPDMLVEISSIAHVRSPSQASPGESK